MLKVSSELRGAEDGHLGEILEQTLSEFSLSKEDLNRYIEEHKSELEDEARKLTF